MEVEAQCLYMFFVFSELHTPYLLVAALVMKIQCFSLRGLSILAVLLLCFSSALVSSATLEVCLSGCPYSSVSMALISARSGDVVHVWQGNYLNEATTNVVITSDITLSGELGAWVALSFAYPINQWLTVNGTLTLVGDIGMLINTGRHTNSAILVSPGGQLLQKGNLYIDGGNARYGGFGVSVQGTWKQTGNLRVEAVGDTSLSGAVQLDQGTWVLDSAAKVDMHLNQGTGVALSTASTWFQKGDVQMRLTQSSNGVACLVNANKIWVQQGRINMTASVFSAGIVLNTGSWVGYGDITMNLLDSGSQGINCYNPTVDVLGNVMVHQGGTCYTLQNQRSCKLKPTSC